MEKGKTSSLFEPGYFKHFGNYIYKILLFLWYLDIVFSISMVIWASLAGQFIQLLRYNVDLDSLKEKVEKNNYKVW